MDANQMDFSNETGLQTKAILARVSIGTWSGRKFDDAATKTVADSFKAQKDCGRFNKLLVDGDEILNLFRIAARARNTHYDFTLPWNDVGTRLLPTKAYNTYVAAMNKHGEEFWSEVNKFYDKYPQLIEKRKSQLGDLWKEKDYPSEKDLKSKYHFELSFAFLPDPASDMRLNLNEVEVEKVRDSVINTMKSVEDRGVKDLWDRMKGVVSKIAERLGDADKSFKKNIFENIDELNNFVELLNVTDNTDISNTMNEIKIELTAYEPDKIRKSDKIRKDVHAKATSILDKISQFM